MKLTTKQAEIIKHLMFQTEAVDKAINTVESAQTEYQRDINEIISNLIKITK
jgi:hypothetical protein